MLMYVCMYGTLVHDMCDCDLRTHQFPCNLNEHFLLFFLKQRKQRIMEDSKRLYVKGSVTEEDLREAFSKHGEIDNIWVARNPPGFAFVTFVEDSAGYVYFTQKSHSNIQTYSNLFLKYGFESVKRNKTHINTHT